MKRSVGVVISGVLGILGSLLCLGFSAIMVVGAFALPADVVLSTTGQSVKLIATFEATAAIGLGMIGMAFSIGLLKRRNWARVGFIGFACFLDAGGLFGILAGILTALLGDRLIQGQQVPPGLMFTTAVATTVISLIGIALGIGWLIYFTRPSVKALFQEGASGTAVLRPGPLSPKIVAWLLIIGGAFTPLILLSSYPALLFGFVLRGSLAKLILAIINLTGMVAGIGMLRWKRWAYTIAITFYSVFVTNQLFLLLVPGAMTRMEGLMLEQPPMAMLRESLSPLLWAGNIFGAIVLLTLLLLLVSRRGAFLEACQATM